MLVKGFWGFGKGRLCGISELEILNSCDLSDMTANVYFAALVVPDIIKTPSATSFFMCFCAAWRLMPKCSETDFESFGASFLKTNSQIKSLISMAAPQDEIVNISLLICKPYLH